MTPKKQQTYFFVSFDPTTCLTKATNFQLSTKSHLEIFLVTFLSNQETKWQLPTGTSSSTNQGQIKTDQSRRGYMRFPAFIGGCVFSTGVLIGLLR